MATTCPLTGPDAVRKRPGMYVGNTHDDSGIVNMLWEVVANALDEHLSGHCSTIAIEIQADGAIAIEDDGRGMPLHDVGGMSFAERALTSMHATPTLDGHAPHEHLGARGVGVFVVCALSSGLELQVCRDGRRWTQQFARGVSVSPLRDAGPSERTGTRITFAPDADVFERKQFDPGPVCVRLQELAMLFPRLTLRLRDRRELVFREPQGLVAGVDRGCGPAARVHAEPFVVEGNVGQLSVEVAARWRRHGPESIESYANVLRTTEGGTHVRGLIEGLADGLCAAASDACARHRCEVVTEAVSKGLTAVVCVRLDDPSYGAPTRDRLVTPAATAAVRACVGKMFAGFLQQNPDLLSMLLDRLPHADQVDRP